MSLLHGVTCPPPASPFRPGDVLTASGLRRLLDAARVRQVRHLATVHGVWGVLAGLTVRADSWDEGGRPCAVVDPGAAVDASGRFRAIPNAVPVGTPPAGRGPWRVVLAFPPGDGLPIPRWEAVPRSLPDDDAAGLVIELTRWRPYELLDPSYRPITARASARFASGTIQRGKLPVVASKLGTGWSARADTSAGHLVGAVAYIVTPLGPPKPGASWSVATSWNDGFVFEADNWPLEDGDSSLPVDLSWIGVETGRDRPALSATATNPSTRSPAMNGALAVTDDPSTSTPVKAGDPFALPIQPKFAAKERLTADELTASFAFLDAMQGMHNRLLHDWGIAAGLGVSAGTGEKGRPLRVEPGLAIDDTGREFVLATATLIDAPSDVETPAGAVRPSEWLLVLHAASEPANAHGKLAWRNPTARSGVRMLLPGKDVVLARVFFLAGAVVQIKADDRRPIRPAAPPTVSGGSTGRGLTVWQPWYSASTPTVGVTPLGVFAHVDANAADLVLLAQLAGTRIDPTSNRVYDGPSFILNQDAGGFDFVVLFPNGMKSWGLSDSDALRRLVGRLKDTLFWSVSWVAVTPSQTAETPNAQQ